MVEPEAEEGGMTEMVAQRKNKNFKDFPEPQLRI